MAAVTIRPLVAGEQDLFESLPDPLPQVRKISYADGLETGGYHPDRTWVALRDSQVVARAAWVLPPGSVGEPWLERFDVIGSPEVGADLLRAAHEAMGGPKIYYAALPGYWRRLPDVQAAVEPALAAARLAGLVEGRERHRFTWAGTPLPEPSGRWTFRPAVNAAEVDELVAAIADPAVLTGAETALVVRGIDIAVDPQAWLGAADWIVALDGDDPVGVAGATMQACFAQIAYLGVRDDAAFGDLLAAAVASQQQAGAREVTADADAHRVATVAELERTGFRRVRTRLAFTPRA